MAQDARAGRRPLQCGPAPAGGRRRRECGGRRALRCSSSVFFFLALAPPGLEQTAERPPRPPADATHRSIYPFVNNPLLAHPAGSNWPAPAGAPAVGGRRARDAVLLVRFI